MKSEAQKTAPPNRRPTAPRPSAFRLPASAFVFLLASWQLSTVASAQTAPTASGIASHSSVDGLDCITADDTNEEALQVTDNSSDLPSYPEGGASVSADKASIPSRTNKKPPQLAETRFDAVLLHDLGTVPIFLVPTHSFYCLREHICERGPPILV